MEKLEKLVRASREGDREAQEQLILKVQDSVYYQCRKMLKNEQDALDATQEVLLAVFKGLKDLEKPGAFLRWMNRITVNVCCKQLRDNREVALPEETALPLLWNFDDQTAPERVLDTEENRRLIIELVDALPEVQRLCVIGYYYNEMSVREIAAAMGTSESTVKSRLFYARKTIKEGVERHAAKGIKLYMVTPLSFIQYFLRQDAAELVLGPSVASAIRTAALAAFAAGAGSAAAPAGTAVLAKTAGALAAHKGLAIAAGIALAGTIGLAALRPAAPEVPPEPPAVEEAVPAPLPIPPQYFSGDTTPLETEPHLVTDYEPPEEPGIPGVPAPSAAPNPSGPSTIVVELEPYIPPEEELQRGREPIRTPRPVQPSENGNRVPGGEEEPARPTVPVPPENPGPVNPGPVDPGPVDPGPVNPGPEGPESPEEPEDPEQPPVPIPPATDDTYRVNPMFGSYLGKNEDGVHEFDLILYSDNKEWYFPFEPTGVYSREVVSDLDRVGITNGRIYGIAPGECKVLYYLSRNAAGPYELKGVANVRVLPETPITPNYDWGGYQRTDGNGVFRYQRTIRAEGPSHPLYRSPLVSGRFYEKVESSDPAVVKVLTAGNFYAVAPGTAEVRYYTRWVPADPWKLTAVVQLTVTSELEPEPPESIRKELRAGYGYASDFISEWGDSLPETLVYTSSKPSVAYIHEKGYFSTLAPGDAVLTAKDPANPGLIYELAVHVEDAFSWTHNLKDMTLTVGESVQHTLEYQTGGLADIIGVTWETSDARIVNLSREDTSGCIIAGMVPGTAEVTANALFLAHTPDGSREMRAIVTFKVLVKEAPPPENPVTEYRKPLLKFGRNRFGYGYDEEFRYMWGEDDPLPENLQYTTSDASVLAINAKGRFTALSAGPAFLTAWDPDEPNVRYILEADVEDRFDGWYPQFSDEEYEFGDTTRFHDFTYSLTGASIKKVEFTSSSPEVVEVMGSFLNPPRCTLRLGRPGTAELTANVSFEVDTCMGRVTMEDSISCRVAVHAPEDMEIIELTDFGYCSGYGYTNSIPALAAERGLDFPETDMYYRSSASNIVALNEKGEFCTMKAGQAILTATPQKGSGPSFAVIVDVQDQLDWTYTIEDLVLKPGESAVHTFSSCEMNWDSASILSTIWRVEDSLMLTVTRQEDSTKTQCLVTSKSVPGVTTVTGNLNISMKGFGMVYESFSFQVRVLEEAVPPEENIEAPPEENKETPPPENNETPETLVPSEEP